MTVEQFVTLLGEYQKRTGATLDQIKKMTIFIGPYRMYDFKVSSTGKVITLEKDIEHGRYDD